MCVCSLLTLFCDFEYVGWSLLSDRGQNLHVFIKVAPSQTRLIGTDLIFELLCLTLVVACPDHLSQSIDSIPCCGLHLLNIVLLPASLVFHPWRDIRLTGGLGQWKCLWYRFRMREYCIHLGSFIPPKLASRDSHYFAFSLIVLLNCWFLLIFLVVGVLRLFTFEI